MGSRTYHVLLTEKGWTVMRTGSTAAPVFATQKEAIAAARRKARPVGQMVVHDRNEKVRMRRTYGMPKLKDLPFKSDLGTERIEEAVWQTIRAQLGVR